MENYKKYTMDKTDRILQPAIGGELILLSNIVFSQEGRFELLEKIDDWENRGD
ncbi:MULTISPECIES: hypothetical protein [Xenorhabdus]|uniref:hypothetical protein n=1 Tax=Xenorhabdus TaxID=626 RepID=UPI000B1E6AF8|nr:MULTISPECIES: hypothetical protein [Xenorhabdus]MBC8946662.1 hypothetical protein [Xenorhabdus indica]